MTVTTAMTHAEPGSPGLPDISRRTLLRAGPAPRPSRLLADAALASTSILDLFREWDAIQVLHDEAPEGRDHDLHDAGAVVRSRLLALPCGGPLDVMAKLVVDTLYGDFAPGAGLMAECEALLIDGLRDDRELA